ncbi:MAG: AAA family ATPase, partial [Gammaproteobacteria bacterium]|nr:AAA family ATPase [Gammaproteobacteria bacterium]
MNHRSKEHPPLITAMLDPGIYDHPVKECRLIETHISWVILTGDVVYKIKKPVNLGFLDFSTLEKRRHFCDEEVRLNRRLAPDIYLGTIAISGTPEHPLLDGQDQPFEYAVKMREFPQEVQLDQLLKRSELGDNHIDQLARVVAHFHQQIAVADENSPFGDQTQIKKAIQDTIDSFRNHLHDPPNIQHLNDLEHWIHLQSDMLASFIKSRKQQGFIRECHGDMHLRNLAWFNNSPLIFDCIEFNANLRWNDVISEIAFLVMDLDDRKQPQLAQRFLNSYLELTGDYNGLRIFSFYLTYRALVRGMVSAIRADQENINEKEKHGAEKEVTEYLRLAKKYTQKRATPVIIARGLSGSGKTTLSQRLLTQIGAIRVRSDVERKRLFGLRADQDGKSAINQGIYTADATQQTYNKLRELTSTILDSGYPVILDATFQKSDQRQLFFSLAREKAVGFIILEFQADENTLKK